MQKYQARRRQLYWLGLFKTDSEFQWISPAELLSALVRFRQWLTDGAHVQVEATKRMLPAVMFHWLETARLSNQSVFGNVSDCCGSMFTQEGKVGTFSQALVVTQGHLP